MYQRADYGKGEHSLDIDFVDPEALQRSLSATFAAPNYRPPVLPAVALQVHELTRSPDASLQDICKVLETDPLLSAGILRVAESAQFARSTPVRSLHEATMRVGLYAVRDHVFRIAMESTVFRGEHFADAMGAVRDHSILVASLARHAIESTAYSHDYAFLAGLLHDVGYAASLLVLAGEKSRGANIDLVLAAPALEKTHEQASETVATLWKLPAELRWVVGAHHSGQIQGYAHPVACAIVIAEELACRVGLGLSMAGAAVDTPKPAAIRRAREALSIDDAAFDRLLRVAEEEIEALAA